MIDPRQEAAMKLFPPYVLRDIERMRHEEMMQIIREMEECDDRTPQ